MADRTHTVGPGKDYASLQAALDWQRTNYPNLTTNNGTGGPGTVTFECYNMQDGATSTGTGWTTNASYYLVIRGAASEITPSNSGIWSTSRYRIVTTNANGLAVYANYTRVLDLQAFVTTTGASGFHAFIGSAATNTRYERCIARASHQGGPTQISVGFSPGGTASTGTHDYVNCVAYDFEAANYGKGFYFSAASTTVNWLNCTTYNCRQGFNRGNGTANAKNCGAAGSEDIGFEGTITLTTCSSATPTFVNGAGRDLHLAAGDTTWKNQGTDLSATFTTDIDGQTRPTGAGTWDIGFDEYVAGGNYTLTAAAGSFAYSGIAALLLRGFLATVGVGGFAETGSAASLLRGYRLDAESSGSALPVHRLVPDAGPFVLAGTGAALRHTYRLDAESSESALPAYRLTSETGAVAFTGTAATLTYLTANRVLVVSAGGFVVNGDASTSLLDRQIAPVAGAFGVTGTDVGLQYGRAVAPAAGSFAVSGTAATFVHVTSHWTTGDPGSFSVSGISASLKAARILPAGSGSLSFTGDDSSAFLNSRIRPAAGAVSLTGTASGLTIGKHIIADPGAFSVTGLAAELKTPHSLAVESGSFSITGSAATLIRVAGHWTIGNPGAFSLSGTSAGLEIGRFLTSASGSFSFMGTDAVLRLVTSIGVESGPFSLSGTDASLKADRSVPSGSGSFAFTGSVAALSHVYTTHPIAAGSGAFSLSGTPATLSITWIPFPAESGSFALSGTPASLEIRRILIAVAGSFGITGAGVTPIYSVPKGGLPDSLVWRFAEPAIPSVGRVPGRRRGRG